MTPGDIGARRHSPYFLWRPGIHFAGKCFEGTGLVTQDTLHLLSRRRLLALSGAAALLALPGRPGRAATPRAAPLTPQDRADIQRIQDYLNGIHTLQSHFDQISGEGGVASGILYVQRPGRMRIVYDPPVPVLILSDGRAVYYWDSKLEQLSQIGLEDTPAWFLLRDNVRLGGDVTVTRFERTPAALRVNFVETKKPENGSVTLTLGDHPLELRQWTVIDAQNKATTVTLIDPRFGGALDPGLFDWVDPRPRARRPGG